MCAILGFVCKVVKKEAKFGKCVQAAEIKM